MENRKHSSQDINRLAYRVLEVARSGIAAGYTDKKVIFKGTAWFAHCERGPVPLFDAHMIALESTRKAFAEVTGK